MSTSELSLVKYSHKTRLTSSMSSSSSFLNNIFMSTVNAAAQTLVSVTKGGIGNDVGKWRPRDHFRFMLMLMTWLTLWVLRVLMDNIPSCSLALGSSSPFNLLQAFSPFGLIDFPRSGSRASDSASLSVSSLQMIMNEGVEAVPVQALGRALSQILALLNEIPATSRKYQFAMAMAERIMDGNARSGHVDMIEINRVALSSAFDRTSNLLHRSLEKRHRDQNNEYSGSGAWAARAVRSLPLGSFVVPYIKGLSMCVGAVRSWVEVIATRRSRGMRRLGGIGGGIGDGGRLVWEEEEGGEVLAEKLAEELLWISYKLRDNGAVEEALAQWSFASGLASVSLTTEPRLQGLVVKISAMLFGQLNREDIEISTVVKFRLLLLWLPLFCHAGNGFAYPVLTYFEKVEVERAIDRAIWSLPPMDQEVILTNWIQDFAVSASDWPNLQNSYDRWCQSTRNLVA